MTELLHKELTGKIIGAYYDVYNGTGRTYPEFVYEKAMLCDVKRMGISCERQEEYQVFYKEWLVGLQRLDLFIAREIVVEIKVVPALTRLHKAQAFSYLKALDKKVGLLLNFGSPKPEFERLYFERHLSSEVTLDVEKRPMPDLPPDLIAPELVYEIIGGLYTVHNLLGPGFIHRIYANACYRELQSRGVDVRPQNEMQIIYRDEPIAAIKFEHLRAGSVALVFPVAVSDLDSIRLNNLKEWLRIEQVPLGILANFHDLSLKPVIVKA